MISCGKSGSQRFVGSESHPDSILRLRRCPAPCTRLGSVGTPGAEENRGRSVLGGRARPAPRNLLAADPPSVGTGGLRVPLEESPPRIAAASPPGAPGYRPRLSGCVARGFPESVADGESDCLAISESSCGTRVREASSYGKVCVAIPDDSMETLNGLGADDATGRIECSGEGTKRANGNGDDRDTR